MLSSEYKKKLKE